MNIDHKIKHLEMIQSIVDRLANNSFLIKGWTITITLAGIGLIINSRNKLPFIILILFLTLIFWILDAYYLRKERLFRKLFDEVVLMNKSKKENMVIYFNMDTSKYEKNVQCLLCIIFSFPTSVIYISIITMTLFFYLKF